MAIFSFSRYCLPSGLLKVMVPGERIAHVDLAADLVLPGGRARILEVRHEHAGAGVERVDHHLAIGRAGDLHAAVLQVGRHRRDLPFAVADVLRLGQEIGQAAGIDLDLAGLAPLEQLEPAGVQGAVQLRDEADGLGVRIEANSDVTGARTSMPAP